MASSLKLYLLLIIVVGLGVRIYGLSLKQDFSHDESISYVDATGHMMAYKAIFTEEDHPLYGKVTTAADFQEYSQVDGKFVFGDVAEGIMDTDMNSPLYFWLLHVFTLIFGVSLHTGLILNLCIYLGFVWVLFKLCQKIFPDARMTLAVLVLFSLSPAVLPFSFEARGNGLLGMWAVWYIYFLLQYADSKESASQMRNGIALLIFGTLGLLTLFTFTTVMFGGLLFLLVHQRKFINKLQLMFIGWSLGAVAIFFVIFPFYQRLLDYFNTASEGGYTTAAREAGTAAAEAGPSFVSEIFTRATVVLYSTLEFFAFQHHLRYGMLLLVGALILWLVYKLGKQWKDFVFDDNPYLKGAVFFGLWNFAVMAGLYLLGLLPPAGVGEQYYMHIWPFFAVITVFILYRLNFMKPIVMAGLAALMLFSAYGAVKNSDYLKPMIQGESLDKAWKPDLFILALHGGIGRGHVPRVMGKLPAETQTLVIHHMDELPDAVRQLENINSVTVYYPYRKPKEDSLNLDQLVLEDYGLEAVPLNPRNVWHEKVSLFHYQKPGS